MTNTLTVGTPAESRKHLIYGGKAVNIQSITIGKDADGKNSFLAWNLQAKADSPVVRAGYLPAAKCQIAFVTNADGVTCMVPSMVNEFSEGELTVDLGKEYVLRYLDNSKYTGVFLRLIKLGKPYLFAELKNGGWKVVSDEIDDDLDYYTRSETIKKAIKEESLKHGEEIAKGLYPEVAIFYALYVPSTSMMRRGIISLFQIKSPKARWRAERRRRINTLMGNVYNIIQKSVGNEVIPIAKVAKKAARLTLAFTNGASFSKPRSFALYTGKFDFADGAGLISAEMFKAGAKITGFELKDVDVCGSTIQGRFATCKGFFSVVDTLSPYVLRCSELNNARLVFVNLNNEDEVLRVMNDFERGGHKNTILVFSKNPSLVGLDMFVDANVCKAGFNPLSVPEFFGMEIPELKKTCRLSSQIVGGVSDIPEMGEIFAEIFSENIADFFRHEDKWQMKISKIGNDGYVDDVIGQFNQSYVIRDPHAAGKAIKKIAQKFTKAINDYSFVVNGSYVKGVPDHGMYFANQGLLAENELYLPGINLSDGQEVVIFRHPKMDKGEYSVMQVVSLKRLLYRINMLNIDGEGRVLYREALRHFVINMKSGNVMLPFQFPELARKLGGADLDGDGYVVVFDQRIVNLYKKVGENAIDFGEIKHSDKELLFDDSVIDNAYLSQIANGNYGVGQMVTFGYIMRQVLHDIKVGNLTQDIWDELIKSSKNWYDKRKPQEEFATGETCSVAEFFKKDKAIHEYIPYVHELLKNGKALDVNAIVDFGRYTYQCDMTKVENFGAMLVDLEPIMASVVGHVIDATKNNEFVPCPVYAALHKLFRSGMKAHFDMDFNTATGVWSVKTPSSGIIYNNRGSANYTTQDDCYILKQKCFDLLAKKLNELQQEVPKHFCLSNVRRPNPALDNALKNIAVANTAMFNAYQRIDENDSSIVNPINTLKPYFTSMARWMTANHSAKERLDLMHSISLVDNGIKKGASRFFQTFGAETLIDALEGHDVELVEQLHAMTPGVEINKLTEVSLENGKDMDQHVFTEEKINGKFNVEIRNGKAFAVSSVESQASAWIKESMDSRLFVLKLTAPRASRYAVVANDFWSTKRQQEINSLIDKVVRMGAANDPVIKGSAVINGVNEVLVDFGSVEMRNRMLKYGFKIHSVQNFGSKTQPKLYLFGELVDEKKA